MDDFSNSDRTNLTLIIVFTLHTILRLTNNLSSVFGFHYETQTLTLTTKIDVIVMFNKIPAPFLCSAYTPSSGMWSRKRICFSSLIILIFSFLSPCSTQILLMPEEAFTIFARIRTLKKRYSKVRSSLWNSPSTSQFRAFQF